MAWTASRGHVHGYVVHYKESTAADQLATTSGDPSTGWVETQPPGHASTTEFLTIEGLDGGKTYDVRVRASYSGRDSPWSATVQSAAWTGVELFGGDLVTGSDGGLHMNIPREDGSDTFWVKLTQAPTGNVVIKPTKAGYNTYGHYDVKAATVTPEALTFTPANYHTGQAVTVIGVADGDDQHEHLIVLALIREASSPPDRYASPAGTNGVYVTIADGTDNGRSHSPSCDNCAAGTEEEGVPAPGTYSVSARAGAAEGGDATLTITLSEAAPAEGVEFTLTAGYGGDAAADDVGSIASPVTVSEGNSALEIAVPTVDDRIDEDDETFTVTVAALTQGWEKEGEGRDTATVTIIDDDTAGVTVSAANPLSVAEDGSSAYTVVLDSRPTHDVTIAAVSDDSGAVSVFPAAFTIAPEDWNVPETFFVDGVSDDDTEDESVGVSHRITSADGKYAAALAGTVSVAVSDTTPPEQQEQSGKYAELISQIYEWRNDPQWVDDKTHTDRWDRALLAFGETVADATLTPMTAQEAQAFADRGWSRWQQVADALRDIESGGQQQETPNRAPTVSAALGDATIVNENGTREVSLAGAFDDADNDDLTITAGSSDEAVATVSVATDYSSLTVTAQSRGTATITVTADDGSGGTVSDSFTLTVKAAPVVASAFGDLTGLEAGATQDISLTGVFSDADGDSLTISATSSDDAVATVTVSADQSTLTVAGVAEGTATVTVTAQDADGNRVSDAFEVAVEKKYAALIKEMYQWRNDPKWVDNKEHTDRWDRALLAFGETVADQSLTPMTAAEAQELADKGWSRWERVADALRDLEAGGG